MCMHMNIPHEGKTDRERDRDRDREAGRLIFTNRKLFVANRCKPVLNLCVCVCVCVCMVLK